MRNQNIKLYEVSFANGHAVMVEAMSPKQAKKRVLSDRRNNLFLQQKWDGPILSVDLVDHEQYNDMKTRWPEAFNDRREQTV